MYSKGDDLIGACCARVFSNISEKTIGDVVREWLRLADEYSKAHGGDASSAGEKIYTEVGASRHDILMQAGCTPRHVTIALQALDYSYSREWSEADLDSLAGNSRPEGYFYSDILN